MSKHKQTVVVKNVIASFFFGQCVQ